MASNALSTERTNGHLYPFFGIAASLFLSAAAVTTDAARKIYRAVSQMHNNPAPQALSIGAAAAPAA